MSTNGTLLPQAYAAPNRALYLGANANSLTPQGGTLVVDGNVSITGANSLFVNTINAVAPIDVVTVASAGFNMPGFRTVTDGANVSYLESVGGATALVISTQDVTQRYIDCVPGTSTSITLCDPADATPSVVITGLSGPGRVYDTVYTTPAGPLTTVVAPSPGFVPGTGVLDTFVADRTGTCFLTIEIGLTGANGGAPGPLTWDPTADALGVSVSAPGPGNITNNQLIPPPSYVSDVKKFVSAMNLMFEVVAGTTYTLNQSLFGAPVVGTDSSQYIYYKIVN